MAERNITRVQCSHNEYMHVIETSAHKNIKVFRPMNHPLCGCFISFFDGIP